MKNIDFFVINLFFKQNLLDELINTVTSRLFTHIVSIEKMRKDMKDRKDMRGTKCTYIL